MARTFKSKYFPWTSLQDYKPKPHHPWTWKNIATPVLPPLQQGRWLIGSGDNIPLTHPDWFHCPNTILLENNLFNVTVADLVNQDTKSWNVDLVRMLYHSPDCEEILNLPLPRTSRIKDRLLLKHSSSGEYKVNKAYRMLHQNEHPQTIQD